MSVPVIMPGSVLQISISVVMSTVTRGPGHPSTLTPLLQLSSAISCPAGERLWLTLKSWGAEITRDLQQTFSCQHLAVNI